MRGARKELTKCGRLWSSRLAPYEASPSTDPGVRLFRTGLLTKLIHKELAINVDIYPWALERVCFHKFEKSIPGVAFLLASSV